METICRYKWNEPGSSLGTVETFTFTDISLSYGIKLERGVLLSLVQQFDCRTQTTSSVTQVNSSTLLVGRLLTRGAWDFSSSSLDLCVWPLECRSSQSLPAITPPWSICSGRAPQRPRSQPAWRCRPGLSRHRRSCGALVSWSCLQRAENRGYTGTAPSVGHHQDPGQSGVKVS